MELIELLIKTKEESVLDKVRDVLTKNDEGFSEEDYLIIDKRRENPGNSHLKSCIINWNVVY